MRFLATGVIFFLWANSIFAQGAEPEPPPAFLQPIDFSGLFFLTYDWEYNIDETLNEFKLKRGYITFRKDISKRVLVRFTQDITIDQEGDGEGDIELRLKYAFVQVSSNDLGFFTSPYVEFGVVHRPWTDFEQKINDYRLQGPMFFDRDKIAVSADYGITFVSLLGGEVDEEYQKRVSSDYPGRYGSLSFGLYNGAGYSELEKNENKLVEGRLSLRLFPDRLPGFQFSTAASYGKGNIPESPEFWMYSNIISYESPRLVATAQGYRGSGDLTGSILDESGRAIPLNGFSFFTELKPFNLPVSLIGRYDHLNEHQSGDWFRKRYITGIAWRFANGSKIILDVDREFRRSGTGHVRFTRYEIGTEIRF